MDDYGITDGMDRIEIRREVQYMSRKIRKIQADMRKESK